MISKRMEKMLIEDMDSLVKPANEVAVVGTSNTLDHALLLMTTNKYSVVPVIDEKSKIKGLISMPVIIEAIMDIEDVRFDKLGEIKVEEIMDTDFPVVTMDFELEDILRMLVHTAFISVVDDDEVLIGIITRQEILTGTNRIVHNFERVYDVKDREAERV
ncbi:CBS domain-containing protein [Atopostipes suicloacalis DSM 15692]|uniref:CBS domain-containing protein n=1 Tax=Atopostipes suicloacalis DSM 15692 TaxID=1121025 RepID=A0A1M4TTM6_9LACT|nr:cyclic-di-AMP-binding protein CbpB [Atopostipes suicloacalis]SHE47849.1 CBS domain-containing protein [Atopostipes suicloacalis DSM 15692]